MPLIVLAGTSGVASGEASPHLDPSLQRLGKRELGYLGTGS